MLHRTMRNVDKHRPGPASDPVPCTSSDEDIRKAEAIREALRRQLLDRHEPQIGEYAVVGAE